MKHRYAVIYPTLLRHGIPVVSFFLGNEVIIGDKSTVLNLEDKNEEKKRRPLSQVIREKEKAKGFTDEEGN